jgi:membrane associated rhomboid family serine protease
MAALTWLAPAEEIYGATRFLVFYTVGTAVGFLLSTIWSPAAISVGSSPGICALGGAMLVLGFRHKTRLRSQIRRPFLKWTAWLIVWSVISPTQDNAATFGGLMAGMALAAVSGTPAHAGWRERAWRAAYYACLILIGVAFLKQIVWFLSVAALF